MKKLLCICAVVLAACATSELADEPRGGPYDTGSRFSGASDGSTAAPDPDQPIVIDIDRKSSIPRLDPTPGLERMPFGGGMSGPWDTGEGTVTLDADGQPDFGRKDLHTVLHYIALRSNLQIIVEGEVGQLLLTFVRVPSGELTRAETLTIIQSICKANKLDYIEDGDVVIVKKRPSDLALAHVVLSEIEGHYNASFEDHELVAAIMEVATVTKKQVFVPALRPREDSDDKTGEERGGGISEVKITLHMRAATPDAILRKLAELGEMDIEALESEDFTGIGYKFKYRD